MKKLIVEVEIKIVLDEKTICLYNCNIMKQEKWNALKREVCIIGHYKSLLWKSTFYAKLNV
jgi:hypothetical protein